MAKVTATSMNNEYETTYGWSYEVEGVNSEQEAIDAVADYRGDNRVSFTEWYYANRDVWSQIELIWHPTADSALGLLRERFPQFDWTVGESENWVYAWRKGEVDPNYGDDEAGWNHCPLASYYVAYAINMVGTDDLLEAGEAPRTRNMSLREALGRDE